VDVEPLGTVTVAGTVSAGLLDDRDSFMPSLGAILDSVTVQDVLELVSSLEAEQCRVDTVTGASNEMVTGSDAPLREAVNVALPLAVAAPAVAVKVAEVEPAWTVTDGGTVRAGLLEDIATAVPPAGAALDSVMVHEVMVL
jgi:hypothetical protein